MNVVLWICTIGLILLGTLGLVEKLKPLKLSKAIWIALLVVFLVFSIGQVLLSARLAKKAPEDFYAQEVTEIFPRNDPNAQVTFGKDSEGNQSAIFVLEAVPIPNSVHLWEGGYHAPPIALAVDDDKVVFKHSAFSSAQEYANGQSVYQIKYIPKP